MTSFAFKLIHDLLPHEARLSRVLPNSSPVCKHGCPGDPIADKHHVFFHCRLTGQVGLWLLNIVRKSEPDISVSSIANLEVTDEPVIWITTATLKILWDTRSKGKTAQIEDVHAQLMSDLKILQNTKYEKIASLSMIQIST